MPKLQYVQDLAPGTLVRAVFYLTDKQRCVGNRPHKCTLRDRTGDIPAICWPSNARVDWLAVEAAGYAEVHGLAEYNPYVGGPQVVIEECIPCPAPEDSSDFLPAGRTDTQELWDRFTCLSESVVDPTLRAVLQHFRDDTAFCLAFRRAPGAKKLHHAYCGGLLEHSLEVAGLVEALVRPLRLNRDLAVTAALLHDIGKVEELDHSSPAFSHTAPGGFFGHVYLGAERVRAALRAHGLAEDQMGQLLCHLLLSHHERREWGAPVQPAVMEAFALAACDNLSARRFYLDEACRGLRAGEAFAYSKPIEGWVFTGSYPRGDVEELRDEPPFQAPPPQPYVREEPSPTVFLPLLGSIVAGVPVEEQQAIEEYVPVARAGGAEEDDFLLRVRGDSMRDAHIVEGDLVRVRPGREPKTGDIVVALVDGESTVKYLAKKRGKPALRPANPAYKDIVPRDDLQIQGVVVGVLRGLR